jgi:hypothetical protein
VKHASRTYHAEVAIRLLLRAAKNLRQQVKAIPQWVGLEGRAVELDALVRDLEVSLWPVPPLPRRRRSQSGGRS